MLFNSIEYLIFFPVVVALYYIISHKWRWLFLLIASYYFYMCWKAEYIVLIIATTLVVYYTGILMGRGNARSKERKARSEERRAKSGKRMYLILCIIINLGILAFFKYVNLFGDSFNFFFKEFNILYRFPELNILVPVGLSFYTFQSIGYTIDVYRGVTTPETHPGKFALFVAFFPQLLSGPIERSRRLLPQIHEKKEFSEELLVSGLKLMVWGFFKKLVIADRLGTFVSSVYDNPTGQSSVPIIAATVLFAFQLYCDFSGYTDIARGSARVLGFDLMINFNRPLIAKSITEFWQRWHISLTSWFRDYLFFSLPYIRKNKIIHWRIYLNMLITFLLIGLWHGAKWTFVFFGLIQGFYMITEAVTQKYRHRINQTLKFDKIPKLVNIGSTCITFALLCFSILFFRANSFSDSFLLIGRSFHFTNIAGSIMDILGNNEVTFAILQIIILLVVEQYHAKHNLIKWVGNRPVYLSWTIYIAFVFYILIFGILSKKEFLYFQF
ncbi:MAG: MBOAT family protein [Bacteroidetes bacterium]|nr:MBOAT family protein [Bacteroidota bacterium]